MKTKHRPPPKKKIPVSFMAYLLKGIREIRDAAVQPKKEDNSNADNRC